MKKRVLFLHPDLGIGGAERLVVDAALALISKGHDVHFVTTHYDETHCFAETKNGSFTVTVVGDWIPRNIFGRLYALCAYIRMIYAALYIVYFSKFDPDVIFCDIVSACIPFLRLCRSKVIFYCHFPDRLLSSPGSTLKHLYRYPLNVIEEKTTGLADVILVNSKFTCDVFKKTFSSINKVPAILYPSINTEFFGKDYSTSFEEVLGCNLDLNRYLFLSINRFERKKNIALAISALPFLKTLLSESEWKQVYLVIAGGYDDRVHENIQHFNELKKMSEQLEVGDKVFFLKSPTDLVKLFLLKQCDCLLYTPSNEHFGIVPLEAMYSAKPVIAINNGGPTETIINGETGYLCDSLPEEFSYAMAKCIKNNDMAIQMGLAGKKRFDEKFSFDAFRDHLNTILDNLDVKGKSD